MKTIANITKAILVFYLATSLVPLLKINHWLVRIWDFPRLQLLSLGFLALLIFSYLSKIQLKTKLLFGFLFFFWGRL